MSQAVERLLKVFEILNAMSVYPVWMCLYVPQCWCLSKDCVPELSDSLGQREREVSGQDEPQWSRFRCFVLLSILLVMGSSAAASHRYCTWLCTWVNLHFTAILREMGSRYPCTASASLHVPSFICWGFLSPSSSPSGVLEPHPFA